MLVNKMSIDKRDFHASGPIVRPDCSIVLIRDMRRLDPHWKFAGGKKQLVKSFGKKLRGETPIECYFREGYEETGLQLKKRETEYVTTEELETHNKHYFISFMGNQKEPNPISKEYEEAKSFTLNELKWLSNFHRNYQAVFYEHMLPLIEMRF